VKLRRRKCRRCGRRITEPDTDYCGARCRLIAGADVLRPSSYNPPDYSTGRRR